MRGNREIAGLSVKMAWIAETAGQYRQISDGVFDLIIDRRKVRFTTYVSAA
jgi:hypothetical protein